MDLSPRLSRLALQLAGRLLHTRPTRSFHLILHAYYFYHPPLFRTRVDQTPTHSGVLSRSISQLQSLSPPPHPFPPNKTTRPARLLPQPIFSTYTSAVRQCARDTEDTGKVATGADSYDAEDPVSGVQAALRAEAGGLPTPGAGSWGVGAGCRG